MTEFEHRILAAAESIAATLSRMGKLMVADYEIDATNERRQVAAERDAAVLLLRRAQHLLQQPVSTSAQKVERRAAIDAWSYELSLTLGDGE